MTSTRAVVADWIKRIADDERKRDAERAREDQKTARKADLVRKNGQRLIDEVRATVTRDVEAFCEEFAGERARGIVVEALTPDGGFAVRKPAHHAPAFLRIPHEVSILLLSFFI